MINTGKIPAARKFTLIELLMVIAIISILMAMLLPGLQLAKEFAYQSYCMNNMKQIGLGFKNYGHDFNNEYPCVARWLDDFSPIYPYVNESLDIFICPKTHTPELKSVADLVGGTDYLSSGTPQDIENCENNGHGNNDYKFDISNPSKPTEIIISYKKTERILYERHYRGHFNGFNVIYLQDLHYETDKGVSGYWTLNANGEIERSLEPFPDL